jgi:hypothetical protein
MPHSYNRQFRKRYPRYRGGHNYIYYGNLFYPFGYSYYNYNNAQTRYGSCVAHGNTRTVLTDNCNYLNGMRAYPLSNGACTCVNVNGIDFGYNNIPGASSY